MAHIEDDFAAYTTIGDRVAPPSSSAVKQSSSTPQGPKFGVPAKLEVSHLIHSYTLYAPLNTSHRAVRAESDVSLPTSFSSFLENSHSLY